MDEQPHEKIVFVRESTESTGDHHYADTGTTQPVVLDEPDRTPLAIMSLILALPFPVTIITLWVTFNTIKGQAQSFSNVTMNAVFLYLFQFFVIPVLLSPRISRFSAEIVDFSLHSEAFVIILQRWSILSLNVLTRIGRNIPHIRRTIGFSLPGI